MGDNLLMKIYIYIIFFMMTFSSSHAQSMDLGWVDQQIEAIIPQRSGIDIQSINNIKEPFVFLKDENVTTDEEIVFNTDIMESNGTITEVQVVKLEPLKLTAIINKNALIDKKWYKLEEKVREMTVVEIKKDNIVLKDRYNKYSHLFISQDNEKIKLTSSKDAP
jgi:uncharacterized protein YdcH (DUF465 family)